MITYEWCRQRHPVAQGDRAVLLHRALIDAFSRATDLRASRISKQFRGGRGNGDRSRDASTHGCVL
ncbi:MAG: hypothetical protein R3C12_25625 [Planctomycetaceae bacterium]